MILKICNQIFESEEITGLQIREKEVFIDGKEDFYRLKIKTEEDIHDAKIYLKLQELSYQDLYDALRVLQAVCDVYINSKEQCAECPLYKSYGCAVQTIPNNWT